MSPLPMIQWSVCYGCVTAPAEGGNADNGQVITPRKIIATAGGFEANLDWLAEGWGDAARNFLVRGTPFNTGTILRSLLDGGAAPVGQLDQCHAVAIDARAPKFDGGIASRIDGGAFRHCGQSRWRAFL